MAVTTADDRKQRFIDLLHELFQLDKPELDFGLYRIMHAKSDQLSRFIREDLAESIEEAFAEQSEQQLTAMRQEIEEKLCQAEELGAPDPDSAPAVKQARAAYDAVKREQNASADIYDHLYRFFSRYYDKGDFMSRRHHVAENDSRAAPYAVPYDGREVYLHWANKDQYYVKSSETLANYTFNLNEALKKLHGSAAQSGLGFDMVDAALKVHCRVVDATEGEHNNVKESTERYFIIHNEEPVRLEGADLVLQFEYRPDPDKTGQSGTWQKKRLEEAEDVIIAVLSTTDGVAAYRDGLPTPAPTDKQRSRTLLGKYLQQYAARNTMDYFIHKDLGGFLFRELDFYIKNEILRLDDIDNADVLIVEQQLKKIQVLRKIAKRIITFLAQLENFQKRLWLKKKFITEVNYCVTLDLLEHDKELLFTIFSHERQRQQWQDIYAINVDELVDKLSREGVERLLDIEKYRYLMADTALFESKEVKFKIASLVTEKKDAGVLINADNFQALSLAARKIYADVDFVYLDPPYNTDATEILYKNGYKSSSWLSLMHDRIAIGRNIISQTGVFCLTIDDQELSKANELLDLEFGKDNHLSTVVIRNNPSGRSTVKGFSVNHEYGLFFAKDAGSVRVGRLRHNEEQKARYDLSDEVGQYEWENFRKSSAGSDRGSRPKQYYPFYFNNKEKSLRVPEMEWSEEGKKYIKISQPEEGESVIYPKNSSGQDKVWRWGLERTKREVADLKVEWVGQRYEIYGKKYLNSKGVLPRTWWDKPDYSARDNGTRDLRSGFYNGVDFDFPKSIQAVSDSILIGCENDQGLVLDYFSGSGTTGAAVIKMNKDLGHNRKYFLIEMGKHFDTVLKPRIQKSAYSDIWNSGAPKVNNEGKLNGFSHCFKYLRLESYDDTLNNLVLNEDSQRDALMEKNPELRHDYTLKYLLDVETRGSASLLNTEWFRDPESYKLKVKQSGSDETRETAVDLVETFNWLIGLHVTHLDKPRTYVARFEREKDPELPGDQNTRLKAASLRENEDGAYWIRQVEGHVRRMPGSDEDLAKVLVVWRKLTGDPEKDAAVLEALLAKYKIGTNDSEFDAIYINGPHGLNLTGSARNRVHSLEETFHARMWEGCDDEL